MSIERRTISIFCAELFEESGVNDPEMEAVVACLCAAARGMADRRNAAA